MKIILFLVVFFFLFSITAPAYCEDGIEPVSRIGNGWDKARAIEVRGNLAYIATGVSGLQIVDISNPDSLFIVSFLDDMPGIACDIVLRDNFALIANYNAGLTIIDIDDPEHPLEFANCRDIGEVRTISLSETHAFLTCLDSGFAVVDITDMTTPQLINFTRVEESHHMRNLFIHDNYAILCKGFYGLRIFDISDAGNPEEIEVESIGDLVSFVIRDNFAFVIGSVGSAGGEISIYDISDFESWERLGSLITWNKANCISVHENNAYCLGGDLYDPYISVVDISNPEDPELQTTGRSKYQPYDMVIAEGMGFVSMGDYIRSSPGYYVGDVGVLDLTITDSLNWISHLDPTGHTNILKRVDNIVFTRTDGHNLHCYDISDPNSPVLLSIYDNEVYIMDFEIRDNLIFIINRTKLSVIDFSDTENPSLAEQLIFANGLNAQTINISGNYAYIHSDQANRNDRLYVFDIEDIHFIDDIRSIGLRQSRENPKTRINGNRIYISDRHSCDVFDISNPERPVQTDITIRSTSCCAFKEDYIFTAYDNRIVIRSLADPDTIVPVDTLYTRADIKSMGVSGDYLYIAESRDGFEIYSVEDIENCYPVGYYDTPGGAFDINVFNQYVLVADWTNLGIYDCTGVLAVDRNINHHIPETTMLYPGYPNPFNSEVTIQYQLPHNGLTKLSVIDPLGREVKTLFVGESSPGSYKRIWDAGTFPSGIYFAVLEVNSAILMKKLVLLR